MQTAVTVVNLIHDTKNETDTPVCWPFPVCSWRECRSTSGNGTAKDPQRNTHVRIPAGVCTQGYLPYAQWAALSAAEKEKHWTLKRGWKLVHDGLSEITGTLIRSKVALLFDWDNMWAIDDVKALGQESKKYPETCMSVYKVFR